MTKERIEKYLKNKLSVTVYDLTDSTNKQARLFLQKNNCERAVFVANGQTEGRGRLGRGFFSPHGSGVYMTYVFATDKELCDIVHVTTAASVAVARALDCGAQIKWVNDIYLDGKKICGILTESVTDKEGRLTHIIIGIGINITTAAFPDDIKDKAGSIGTDIDKDRLVANICDNLFAVADDITSADYLDYYRQHLYGLGKEITYIQNNTEHSAVIEGVDDRGGLIVCENGEKKTLTSGEITFRF